MEFSKCQTYAVSVKHAAICLIKQLYGTDLHSGVHRPQAPGSRLQAVWSNVQHFSRYRVLKDWRDHCVLLSFSYSHLPLSPPSIFPSPPSPSVSAQRISPSYGPWERCELMRVRAEPAYEHVLVDLELK